MNYSEIIATEIKVETGNTKRIISAFKDEHLDWRPHAKSMTVGELAAHVVELHNWMELALQKERFDFHTDYRPLKCTSIADLMQILDEKLKSNLAVIASLTDENWQSSWTLAAGEHVIHSSNKVNAARFIIQNHLIHHRGQLSLYLRLLDLPVPGIYGPSADEKQ